METWAPRILDSDSIRRPRSPAQSSAVPTGLRNHFGNAYPTLKRGANERCASGAASGANSCVNQRFASLWDSAEYWAAHPTLTPHGHGPVRGDPGKRGANTRCASGAAPVPNVCVSEMFASQRNICITAKCSLHSETFASPRNVCIAAGRSRRSEMFALKRDVRNEARCLDLTGRRIRCPVLPRNANVGRVLENAPHAVTPFCVSFTG
jgi:hypothetical protein